MLPMTRTRRALLLQAMGLPLVAACGAPAVRSAAADGRAPRPATNAGWSAWVRGFRARAAARGIEAATFDRAFAGAGYLPEVIERDRNQSEFRRSFEDYLQLVASEVRVREGRAALSRHRRTLDAIAARWGVPAEIVAAIWGVESRYGARRGVIPVVSATSTLAFDGRRGRFFESQCLAALRIVQAGDVAPARMVGSWAGAMGHTQFIPTSYLAYAVDFTGDGRRDIWSADPADALASTAAYLARSGWRRGALAAVESPSGGLRPDPGGPAFRTGPNFGVIKRYNNSDSYALAVSYLAGRIAGGGPLRAGFGPDRFGLTLDQRIALQRRLAAAGHDVGEADGVIGPATRRAVAAAQRRLGLPETGAPDAVLLRALGG